MPAHPDVIPSLKQLQAAGFRIFALANSSSDVLTAQFENAGIAEFFEQVISVEDVQAFKPDPSPYLHALKVLDLKPNEVAMVAAHAWDLIGAKNVGLSTVFIKRKGQVLYPSAARPDYVLDDFSELLTALTR